MLQVVVPAKAGTQRLLNANIHAARFGLWRAVPIAFVLALLTGAATTPRIELRDAWLRPSLAGQPSAAVFVDIRSDTPLRLVGASSPAAKRIEIVRNEARGDPSGDGVVDSMPVEPNALTRLAYKGNYLRLIDVTRDLHSGDRIPIELAFVDDGRNRHVANTEALVRGLVPRATPGAPMYSPGSKAVN